MTSQPKPCDFLNLEVGTLAPFVEIPAPSSEILAPFGPILLNLVCMNQKQCLYVFNYSTHTWYWIHYTMQIIVQPCLVFVNIPSSIPVLGHLPLHVDTPGPFLENDLSERYFVLLVVIDNERAGISLDGYDLDFSKLSHHSRWAVRTQYSDARKD